MYEIPAKIGEGVGDDHEDGTTHSCGNCGAPDAKGKCKGCGVEYYCDRECQTVGLKGYGLKGYGFG